MRRLVLAAAAACLCVFLASVIVLTSARWSGRFTLRVILTLPENVDRKSLGYVECWSEDQARWLCQPGSETDPGFTAADRSDTDADLISVSSGGSSDLLGLNDSYHHPAYIVVQYVRVSKDGSKSPHRVCVPIPNGRGDRTVSVDLTQDGG